MDAAALELSVELLKGQAFVLLRLQSKLLLLASALQVSVVHCNGWIPCVIFLRDVADATKVPLTDCLRRPDTIAVLKGLLLQLQLLCPTSIHLSIMLDVYGCVYLTMAEGVCVSAPNQLFRHCLALLLRACMRHFR